jgi:hypothetical protein
MASTIVSMVLLSFLVTILVAPIASAIRKRGGPGWLGLAAALGSYVAALAAVVLITRDRPRPPHRRRPGRRRRARQHDHGDPRRLGCSPRRRDGLRSIATDLAQSALSGLAIIGYSVIIVAYLLIEHRRPDPDRVGVPRQPGPRPAGHGSCAASAGLPDRPRGARPARGVLDTAVLLVVGVPSAFLWGLLAFLMSFVPNVGFIIS